MAKILVLSFIETKALLTTTSPKRLCLQKDTKDAQHPNLNFHWHSNNAVLQGNNEKHEKEAARR